MPSPLLDSGLEFNEAEHTYHVSGQRRDSVTDLLKQFGMMPGIRYATDEHLWRGQQIHEAMRLYHNGTLAMASLDPAIGPYLRSWDRFVLETGWRTLGFEIPMVHPLLGFCGRPDVWGIVRDEFWVVDYKSGGLTPSVRLQLAGYGSLLLVNGHVPVNMRHCIRRVGIQLKPEEDYNLKPCDDPTDIAVWSMMVSVNNWRKENV